MLRIKVESGGQTRPVPGKNWNQGFTQSEKNRIPHNSEKGSNPLTVKKGTEDRTEGKKRGKEDKL